VVLEHHRQGEHAHRHHRGADHAGGGREQRADRDDRDRQAAAQAPEQHPHGLEQLLGQPDFSSMTPMNTKNGTATRV
jgi:hypothetical protein